MNASTRVAGVALLAVLAAGISAAAEDGLETVGPEELRALVAKHAGQPLVVNLWASWCPPCVKEFPDIVRLYNDYHSKGPAVIAVSLNAADEIEDVDAFLQRHRPPFPVYRAVPADETLLKGLAQPWFGELPVTLVFDSAGTLARYHRKPVTYSELAAELDELLASATQSR